MVSSLKPWSKTQNFFFQLLMASPWLMGNDLPQHLGSSFESQSTEKIFVCMKKR